MGVVALIAQILGFHEDARTVPYEYVLKLDPVGEAALVQGPTKQPTST